MSLNIFIEGKGNMSLNIFIEGKGNMSLTVILWHLNRHREREHFRIALLYTEYLYRGKRQHVTLALLLGWAQLLPVVAREDVYGFKIGMLIFIWTRSYFLLSLHTTTTTKSNFMLKLSFQCFRYSRAEAHVPPWNNFFYYSYIFIIFNFQKLGRTIASKNWIYDFFPDPAKL